MEQSVASMFELYLTRSDLRPASVEIKRRACRFFVRWFGDPTVGAVSSVMAEDFRTMLGRGRRAVSVNGYLDNFKPFWSWLLRHGYISRNPFATVQRLTVDEGPPKRTFTPAELAAIVTVADDLWRLRLCFGLMGARRGEMLAVQGRDCRLDQEIPAVVLGAKVAGKRTMDWGTKSHKLRYLGLPERIALGQVIVPFRAMLAERVDQLGSEGYVCLPADRSEYLLTEQAHGRLRYSHRVDPAGNFARQFRSLQKRAGLCQPRRFHELRAAFITEMITAFDVGRAADLAGHASAEQTRKYDRKDKLLLVAEAGRIAESAYVSKVS